MIGSEKISKKMMAIVFVPLVVPSLSLIIFALSGYVKDGAMMMILVAIGLLLFNIAIFFAVLRTLSSSNSNLNHE